MKKVFEILQDKNWTRFIAIFAICSPVLLSSLAPFGIIAGIIFCWIVALVGAGITGLVYWYLTSTWNVERRGYLVANGAAGVVMVLICGSALFFLHGIFIVEFYRYALITAFFATFGIIWGFFIQNVVKPWKDDPGG